MGIAFHHHLPALRLRTRASALPPEIAFLREYGVATHRLEAAAREAAALGVGAVEALLAPGDITDTLFYKSLADLIDVPFRLDAALLDPSLRPLRAIRDGRARLADGTHLLAPRGATIRLLVEAAATPDLVPRDIALTTPAHLEALVLRRSGSALARRASLALPSLEPGLSAHGKADRRAAFAAASLAAAAAAWWMLAPQSLALVADAIFLAAVVLRWLACLVGRHAAEAGEPPPLPERDLPAYSVLVPLCREAGMVPRLVRHLADLDYPAARLEVLFLVERDDAATSAALRTAPKPPHMRVVVVPAGAPRTKPRALNLGLLLAKGSLVTVYDAEDRPDPDQLRRAAARYAVATEDLACLQARLAIAEGNLLQRLFALEYRVLFELFDAGLARLGLPLPLGGTSNHFRASALRAVGGWDAWNVTEDADLGLRLVRFGYRVDMLASTTSEEAPAGLGVWIRQRRRWTKGWMQVALVLLRDGSTLRDLGLERAALVALLLTGMVVGPLATPVVLAFALRQAWVGALPTGFVAGVTMAVPLLAVAAILWCAWAARGVAPAGGRRDDRVLLALLLLPYQALIAAAAWGGLLDLARDPYHWRKTPHGAEALSRSSPAAPRLRRKARRPARPG